MYCRTSDLVYNTSTITNIQIHCVEPSNKFKLRSFKNKVLIIIKYLHKSCFFFQIRKTESFLRFISVGIDKAHTAIPHQSLFVNT